MNRRFHFRFFGTGIYGYFCKVCRKADLRFPSYRALRRHQFGPDACLRKHSEPKVVAWDDPPFEGERIPVPTSPTTLEDLTEHRDSNGRLRVSGILTGYRHWAVGRVDGQFRLFPVFMGRRAAVPYARGVTTAHCAAEEPGEPHRSPDGDCSCGLYALWEFKDAAFHRRMVQHATILGRVEAWGKIVPGTDGFRSERAMVTELYMPSCTVLGCDGASSQFVARPRWIEWMTPGGRTYPRINDRRHETYRDTADFTSCIPRTEYLGWFCEAHSKGELIPPDYANYRCNYPRESDGRPCTRSSTFTFAGLPFSWCHEHAPLVFDASEVMEGLHTFYDLATPGTMSVEDYLSPGGPGNRPS